jgi:transaldolase
LEELKNDASPVPKKLDAAAGTSPSLLAFSDPNFILASAASAAPISKVSYVDNEPEFRWTLLQDSMAFDKLHEGIKKFAEDGNTLKALLRKKLEA